MGKVNLCLDACWELSAFNARSGGVGVFVEQATNVKFYFTAEFGKPSFREISALIERPLASARWLVILNRKVVVREIVAHENRSLCHREVVTERPASVCL